MSAAVTAPFACARDGGHGGKARRILQQAGARTFAEIQHRRDQHEPLHPDALMDLQFANDLRSANAAIAFADDKFRREQAVGLFQPAADRHRDRVDVAVDREKPLARVLAGRNEAAIAGPDRIDEDEIGEVEPGLGIGLQIGRSGSNRRISIDRQPPGSGRAELQKGGGSPRPAIEKESDRPRRRIGAVQPIGRVGDIGLRLALVVEQADRARGRREGERAPGENQRLLGRGIRRQTMQLGSDRRI